MSTINSRAVSDLLELTHNAGRGFDKYQQFKIIKQIEKIIRRERKLVLGRRIPGNPWKSTVRCY